MPDGSVLPSPVSERFGQGFLRDCWWFAAPSASLKPGAMRREVMLGEPVLLGRTRAGAAFALRDVCPHRAAPLSAGALVSEGGEETVACPYHGWRFGVDGGCRAIPSLVDGQEMEVERIRVRRYPVAESQGLLFVWFGADARGVGEPDQPPPTFPGVVGDRPRLVEATTFAAHVDHAVVGLMDPAHGPYVHQQWWWRSAHSQHEKAKRFEPRAEGFAMAAHQPSSNSYLYRLLGGAPVTEIVFRLPALRWEHVTVGPRQVLALTCLTPVDAQSTRITQLMWSDHWAFGVLKPLLAAATRRFLRQDGDMVELQNQGLAYDPSLLWIDDADTQARWYVQLKREWTASRREGRALRNPVPETVLRWRS